MSDHQHPSRDEPAAPGATIRLIATDLDGTLLRSDGTVSLRTRRALEAAAGQGITVVLVSARPPRRLRTMAAAVGVRGLGICCNGALVYDLEQEAIVQHAPLAPEVAGRLVTAIRAAAPGACFAVELGTRFGREPAYHAITEPEPGEAFLLADGLRLCRDPVTKLIARHPALPRDDLFGLVRELAGDIASVTHSGAPWVEIAAPGVDKAWALERLCDQRGIAPAQVIAFGDMPNDLPMLRWSGQSVAVANAHPEVLVEATTRTRSNDEDGVALVLERLLQLPGPFVSLD